MGALSEARTTPTCRVARSQSSAKIGHLTFPRRRELPPAEWTYAQCLDTLMRASAAVVSLALERRPNMDICMARLDVMSANT